MKASENLIAKLKVFEGGPYLKAYLCPAGVWTIGWGSTRMKDGRAVRRGDVITEEVAEFLLRRDVVGVERELAEVLKGVKVTQGMWDALTDFCYNLGIGALKGSTLLRKMKLNSWDTTIGAEFLRWNKARDPKTGILKELEGLTMRRRWEAFVYYK